MFFYIIIPSHSFAASPIINATIDTVLQIISISRVWRQKGRSLVRQIPQLHTNMMIIAMMNADVIAARTFCVIRKGKINKALVPRYVVPVTNPANIA